jgi:hypothetical protein
MDVTTLNLLLGAGLALGPATVAWLSGRRSGMRAASRPPTLDCSCGHGFGTHANAGACSGSTKRNVALTSYSEPPAWEWVPCPCHSYDGPEPLPRSWSVDMGLFDPRMTPGPLPGAANQHRSLDA